MYAQLLERREALFKKSEARHARLEEAYRYHAFERDADETKSWINEKLKIAKDESYMDPTNLQVSYMPKFKSVKNFKILWRDLTMALSKVRG